MEHYVIYKGFLKSNPGFNLDYTAQYEPYDISNNSFETEEDAVDTIFNVLTDEGYMPKQISSSDLFINIHHCPDYIYLCTDVDDQEGEEFLMIFDIRKEIKED